ncbi:MAG: hypothetical protein LDL33_14825 [Desulfomonile sp.]|nr:hypothetical protein [Desulfomonile sp.]
MARVLYGVMGDAAGHVNRALIMAQEMSAHEFIFVGGGRAHDLKSFGYTVEDVPMPATLYRNNRVDIPATVMNALRVFVRSGPVVRRVKEIITAFDPDLIVTDYEYFTPLAARKLGRLCVSLDHQHIITHCSYTVPPEERFSRFMTGWSIRRLYSRADRYVIISFFHLPAKDPAKTEVFPPILRRAVVERRATEGDHVLVYQTSPTFHRLFPILEKIDRRFVIYGFGEQPERGNLLFKERSTDGFLEDLASSQWVIANGSHNVVSEALYLGKPVFSFPIAYAYEQFFNAYFLAKLGFGAYSLGACQSEKALIEFATRVDEYRARLHQENFLGNEVVAKRLEEIAAGTIRKEDHA